MSEIRVWPRAVALLVLLTGTPATLWAAPSSARQAPAAEQTAVDPCARPAAGSVVADPIDLRSKNGVLSVDLKVRNSPQPDGSMHFCYLLGDGSQSPTLRLHPGDLLVLKLKNDIIGANAAAAALTTTPAQDPCNSGVMSSTATNLHFHGLTLPPVCHQDDVLKTSIEAGAAPFQYRFRIPLGEQPGLYWYHPHIHGFSAVQVLGGASGALVVEGIERAASTLAGLPERVLVIRDQNLVNPDAPPAKSEPVVPKMLIDRDGDSANNGTGFGKPAKDLSLNFVPVPYPDYPPASLEMRPNERQLWRVLNASAITYLNLAVLFDREPQQLELVAMDGVPLGANGNPDNAVIVRDHIGLPPGARIEFVVTGPPRGVAALFVTRTVDTGQGGENDPNRALATINVSDDAPEPKSRLPQAGAPLLRKTLPWLGDVAPVRVRKLYFSEKLLEPHNPNSATEFYLTVDGQKPATYDPSSSEPNIVVHQGDVEDWIIENRSTELHAFHIHQLHFLLIDWSGRPVDEPFLRDTVNVPYYSGRMLKYPSVRLRMDFRDPNTVGTFVYHCHLLEHEDGGMMGTVRVQSAGQLHAGPLLR